MERAARFYRAGAGSIPAEGVRENKTMDEILTVYVDGRGEAWAITRRDDRLMERHLPTLNMNDDFRAILPTVDAVGQLARTMYV